MADESTTIPNPYVRSLGLLRRWVDDEPRWLVRWDDRLQSGRLVEAEPLEQESFRESLDRELGWTLRLGRRQDYIVSNVPRLHFRRDYEQCGGENALQVVVEFYVVELYGEAAIRQLSKDGLNQWWSGGEIIAAQLREIGIELELINVEWGQWLEDVFKTKNYDLSIVSHVEPFDIGIYANPDYYFQYDNVVFQAIIEKLNVTADETKRKQLAQAAQRILAEDAVNGYLFQLAKTGVWSANLEGMWPNSPVEGNDLTAVRWTN